MPIFTVGVLIALTAAVLALRRTDDPVRRARSLRKAGLILTAAFSTFLALFIVGETFADPGGWRAVGYVGTWALPVTVLLWLAWFRPAVATSVSEVLVAIVFALYLWSAVASDAWRSFENSVGPVRTIVSFAIAAPLALLGWKRPFAAGVMLLLLMVPPAVLLVSGPGVIGSSIFAVLSPATITGVMYLFASRFERGPGVRTRDGRSGSPMPPTPQAEDQSVRDYVKAPKPVLH